jgi:hypothetical protein
MHFTRGDVGAISFRSKSTTDLHSGVEKRPSRRDISKSAFARVFGLIAFRLLQQYLPIADVTKGAPLTPDLDLVGRRPQSKDRRGQFVENADHFGKVVLGMFRYLGENRSILASEL